MEANDNAVRRPMPPRINVVRSLQDVIDDAAQLEKEARRWEAEAQKHLERAERLVDELGAIKRALSQMNWTGIGTVPIINSPVPFGPAPVAHALNASPAESGKIEITIDGGKRITLPPALAALLAALIADGGESPDSLVAYKSFDRLSASMEEKMDRKYDRHALSQLLWRLRELLGDKGIDRRLVQTSTEFGARFRLKRTAPAAEVCTQ